MHHESLEPRRLFSAGASPDFVAGQLLIGFEPGVSDRQIANFYAEHGFSERKALNEHAQGNSRRLKLVEVPAGQTVELIPALERDPRVAYAEPNYLIPGAAVTPNDPDLSQDWGLVNTGQTGGTPDADIDADEAWQFATGGTDVIVAVIDTGVDYTHPDLAANMWHNPGEVEGNGLDDDGNGFVDDYYGYDFANEDGDPMDDNNHGTHCAGTIGMVGNNGVGSAGVNWNTRIMALKTASADGFHQLADLLEAYNYVATMRQRGVNVRVTSNSYGGYNPFIQAWKDAIDDMGREGVLFVAAAANESSDNDAVSGLYPASFESESIISVAATDADDRIASFSNWGATSVDLAAPGVSVLSSVPGGYSWFRGTSMATPHVAGAAALVWSAHPELTAADVKARLLNGVDPIGHIGGNASQPTVTNGRLNVRNALLVPAPDAGDVAPPAPIANLAASGTSPWSVRLNWTASGDDGETGRAGFYDVRYSTSPITAANWADATRAPGEPSPAAAGSAETLTVTGLEPGTVYFFAAKVKDNAGNESGLSNVAQGNTAAARYLLNDDVEAGGGSWSATGLWHRSNLRGHDSATAWYYGQDSTRTYFNDTQDSGTLTLATPIDLTGVSQAVLRFEEWREVSNEPPLDVARVQVSRDGANWATAYESFSATLDWQQRAVDLTPFVGGPVYVRFEFNKNAFDFLPFAITHGHEGWHVDNVQVLVPGAQPAGLAVNDVSFSEGSGGSSRATFTVTRPSGSGRAAVRYATADGSATAASGDYVPASGSLSFASGETRKQVSVTVNGDRLGEPDESFFLNLSGATGAAIADGQGRAAVLDDEPRIYAGSHVVIPEGNDRLTFLLPVQLTVPSSQPVTVSYATADGTATANGDYRPIQGTLTFNPGEASKFIAITLPKDQKAEPLVEVFFLNLSNASGNAVILKRGVIHVVDDDAPHGNGSAGTASTAQSLALTSPFTSTRIPPVWTFDSVEGEGDEVSVV